MNSFLGSGLQSPIKRRVFVSYHHGGDQYYYDAFSKVFHDGYEAIYDNSLERRINSDDSVYVMRQIREKYITGTSCTIVLVGSLTDQRKYVDWEIKATLEKSHGLIGVRLPSARVEGGKTIVPARLHDNIQSGYAVWTSWEELMANQLVLQRLIENANSRSKTLIVNSRELKTRNG
ncbi:MAG: hypothetical protein EOP06_09780 [Proteobacteria bacterium]|nr:MAG: hypothetical protein EOP06_09780 [Pseudomonadota bacterium]